MTASKRPGRPKKPGTVSVTFNVSPELKTSLDEAARGRGLGLSEYIRLQVFGFAETRMENAFAEGVTIKVGPEYPKDWDEFDKRVAQRFITLYQTVEAWRSYLYDSDEAKRRGLSVHEYMAWTGRMFGFDDPTKDPETRLEEFRAYMLEQNSRKE